MTACAVVPVKALARCKERLATVPQAQRGELMLHMLDRVLRSLGDCGRIGRIWVVGGDERVAAVAARHGVPTLPELGRDVNETVQRAAARCWEGDTAALLALNADLPLVRPAEVAAAVGRCLQEGRVLLFPSWDGEGTNGILSPIPGGILASYGPGSLRRHLQLYREHGLPVAVHPSLGLAADLDTPGDAARLLAEHAGELDPEVRRILSRTGHR